MKLALIGMGKMGKMIEQLAPELGHSVVARLDEGDDLTEAKSADVAIEFTSPESAVSNLKSLARHGVATVSGTTGWFEELDDVSSVYEDGKVPLVYGSNFSIGVAIFRQLVSEAATRFASISDYEAYVYEAHHSAKLDAPSGTLKTLIEDMRIAGFKKAIDPGWNRVGKVPGTHEVGFDGSADTITLKHVARSREGFARGALFAAGWIVGKQGVFEFSEIVGMGRISS